MILLDTSALIELAKESKKGLKVLEYCEGEKIAISTITINEILISATKNEETVFRDIFGKLFILPFDEESSYVSVEIEKKLRKKGKIIAKPDIFIGSIAVSNDLSIVTLDNDFKRIDDLEVFLV